MSDLTTPGGRLESLLGENEFVITAEITPKLSASPEDILQQAQPLKGRADAVLLMTYQDRNRIAIAADLIGASALGIRNLLALTGDDPKSGDEPDAKPVFDLSSRNIIEMARRMSDDGKTPSGRALSSHAQLFVGAADAPFDPPADWRPDGLLDKIEAGAGFVQTQFCFEPAIVSRYLGVLEDHGILEKASIIVGVGPIASARSARWMDANLFGVSIPDETISRLEGAGDEAAEGLKVCVELIQAYREMPGVSVVHVMAPAQSAERAAEAIDTSGVLNKRKGG